MQKQGAEGVQIASIPFLFIADRNLGFHSISSATGHGLARGVLEGQDVDEGTEWE
jgi:hypothetical protein